MEESNKPHLKVLVQLAKVDGMADDTELELIRQIGSSNKVSDEDVERAIEEAEALDSIPSLGHLSMEDRFDLVYNLVLVMKADGIIDPEEMRFIHDVVQKVGFQKEVIDDLISHSPDEDPDGSHRQEIIERARKFYQE